MQAENDERRQAGLPTALGGAFLIAWVDALVHAGELAGLYGHDQGRAKLAAIVVAAWTAGAWIGRSRRMKSRLAPIFVALVAWSAFVLDPVGLTANRAAASVAATALVLGVLDRSLRSDSGSVAARFLGAAVGLVLIEWLLVPWVGWIPTLALISIAWLIGAWRAGDSRVEASERPTLALRLPAAALLGVALGCAASFLWPLVFQHVEPTRVGGRAVVLASLVALAVGAWLFDRLAVGPKSRVALAVGGVALSAYAALIAFSNLQGSRIAFAGRELLPSAVARDVDAIRSSILIVGFLSVALGGLIALAWSRHGAVRLLLALGVVGGLALGERRGLPKLVEARSEGLPLLALITQRSWISPPEMAYVGPDGVLARQRVLPSDTSVETLWFWNAVAVERGPSWAALERAEIALPVSRHGGAALTAFGHATGAQIEQLRAVGAIAASPFPGSSDAGSPWGAHPLRLVDRSHAWSGAWVALSRGARTNGASWTELPGFLESVAASRGAAWAWIDPRSLSAQGMTELLSTLRDELDDARLWILADGYAGPLLCVEVGASTDSGAPSVVADLVIASAPLAEAVRELDAPTASFQRPRLEWLAPSSPSPFSHPRADVLRALADALDPERFGGARVLLEAMAEHASAQAVRELVTYSHDRITIPRAEIDALLRALDAAPDYPPLLVHVARVSQLLFEKREIDVMLELNRRASEKRPDVGSFHRQIARAYNELLDLDGAIAEYEIAAALEPNAIEPKRELAWLYRERGDWQRAVELLEQVWHDSPSPNAEIAKALGLGYVELGRYEDAIPLLEYARRAGDNDRETRDALERAQASVE